MTTTVLVPVAADDEPGGWVLDVLEEVLLALLDVEEAEQAQVPAVLRDACARDAVARIGAALRPAQRPSGVGALFGPGGVREHRLLCPVEVQDEDVAVALRAVAALGAGSDVVGEVVEDFAAQLALPHGLLGRERRARALELFGQVVGLVVVTSARRADDAVLLPAAVAAWQGGAGRARRGAGGRLPADRGPLERLVDVRRPDVPVRLVRPDGPRRRCVRARSSRSSAAFAADRPAGDPRLAINAATRVRRRHVTVPGTVPRLGTVPGTARRSTCRPMRCQADASPVPAQALRRAHQVAWQLLAGQVEQSWVPGWLTGRGVDAVLDDPAWQVGRVPPAGGWLPWQLLRAQVPAQVQVVAGWSRRTRDGGLTARWPDRLVVPVYDAHGPCGVMARARPGAPGPKWLNSPGSSLYRKGHLLLGSKPAGQAATVVLVEGPGDVMAVQTACPHVRALALCGTALSERQAAVAVAQVRDGGRLLVATDADPAGRQARGRAVERLAPLLAARDLELGVCALPEGQDPADVHRLGGLGDLLDRSSAGPPVGAVLRGRLERLADQGRPAGVEQRVALLRGVAPLLVAGSADAVPRAVTATAKGLDLPPSVVTRAATRSLHAVGPRAAGPGLAA